MRPTSPVWLALVLRYRLSIYGGSGGLCAVPKKDTNVSTNDSHESLSGTPELKFENCIWDGEQSAAKQNKVYLQN